MISDVLTESSWRHLDVAKFPREVFRSGALASVTWPDGGAIAIRGHRDEIELLYVFRGDETHERVPVEWTACNYGGERPWLHCPNCHRRVRKLYGGARFLCRHCTGFTYASTLESDADRKLERARSIRMRLGGSANMFEPFPPRPTRMRAATYARLRDEERRLWAESLADALAHL